MRPLTAPRACLLLVLVALWAACRDVPALGRPCAAPADCPAPAWTCHAVERICVPGALDDAGPDDGGASDGGAGGLDGGAPGAQVDSLIALYTFTEGGGAVVRDVSGVAPRLDLAIADPTDVEWLQPRGLVVNAGDARIVAAAPSSKLLDRIVDAQAFTVEVWLSTEDDSQSGPARIVALSSGAVEPASFMLGQVGDGLAVRVRTASTTPGGEAGAELVVPEVLGDEGLRHVVLTWTPAGGRVYVDGVLRATTPHQGALAFSLANELRLGNERGGDRPWFGALHEVAVYDRALTQEEVVAEHARGVPAAVDGDGDGVPDAVDGCPLVADPAQPDQDGDGANDACDADRDGDGVADAVDVCPGVSDPDQSDSTELDLDLAPDGVGDACDLCPADASPARGDADSDGVADACDNCPHVANPGQEDGLELPGGVPDGVGDACDPRPTRGGDRILFFEGFEGDALPADLVVERGLWMVSGGRARPLPADGLDARLVLQTQTSSSVLVETRLRFEGDGTGQGSSAWVQFAVNELDDGYACGVGAENAGEGVFLADVVDGQEEGPELAYLVDAAVVAIPGEEHTLLGGARAPFAFCHVPGVAPFALRTALYEGTRVALNVERWPVSFEHLVVYELAGNYNPDGILVDDRGDLSVPGSLDPLQVGAVDSAGVSLRPSGDLDCFLIELPDPAGLLVELSQLDGSCPTGLRPALAAYEATATDLAAEDVAFDLEGLDDSCPLLLMQREAGPVVVCAAAFEVFAGGVAPVQPAPQLRLRARAVPIGPAGGESCAAATPLPGASGALVARSEAAAADEDAPAGCAGLPFDHAGPSGADVAYAFDLQPGESCGGAYALDLDFDEFFYVLNATSGCGFGEDLLRGVDTLSLTNTTGQPQSYCLVLDREHDAPSGGTYALEWAITGP